MTGQRADEYSDDTLEKVKATCLTVATVLGNDVMSDTVIVGGFVPALLFADTTPHDDLGRHVGTLDLDLAMDLVVLNEERYNDIADALRDHGFEPDVKELSGALVRQRWRSRNGVRVDFLMPPVPPDEEGNRLQHLAADFAAHTMRGMDLALATRVAITLEGLDVDKRKVRREIRVCRADAFIALKALALANRDKAKDAYDIHYVLKHVDGGPGGVGTLLASSGEHPIFAEVRKTLGEDYRSIDGRGPRMVCDFLGRADDEALAADAMAHVGEFLRAFGAR